MAVAATVYRPGVDRGILVHYINVASQPQELHVCAGSVLGIFLQLDKEQLRENHGVGHCAGICYGHDMEQCLVHMVTLLKQALKVYTRPGLEVQQLLVKYADVFSR